MSAQNTQPVDELSEDELSEDMEVVGPGLMLSDARKKVSMAVEDIAEKLKFKKCLVENIEQDIFDQKLPATYNRGYLRSYAKLVNIDVDEVLSAYDMLGVAEVQRSEMQSFSNLTEKQTEHSRIMWFSYFIVALLLGLMVLWWLQEPAQLTDEGSHKSPQVIAQQKVSSNEQKANEQQSTALAKSASAQPENVTNEPDKTQIDNTAAEKLFAEQEVNNSKITEVNESTIKAVTPEVIQEAVAELSTAIFTFSGDCWVNIYDATGERIAWGVKKSGYVMTIIGKAPLNITLGKPELAAIVFNDQAIDMSPFNVGNIAKFTLPLNL